MDSGDVDSGTGTGPEITAGRLHLRPWQPGDAAAVLEACTDPELLRWTTLPSPYGPEDARGFVETWAPAAWADGTGAPFAVLDATTGGLLASVGLQRVDRGQRTAELGFWCARPERGRGVVTEAVGVVCRWGFAELALERVEWIAEVGNHASRRVAEKAGFQHEGVARGRMRHAGVQRDAWVAALLPGDLR